MDNDTTQEAGPTLPLRTRAPTREAPGTHTLDDAMAALSAEPVEYVAAHVRSDSLANAALDEIAPQMRAALGANRTPYLVALPERFALYLQERAAAHGHSPEHHMEVILRTFWHHDEWRQKRAGTKPEQLGDPAGTYRRA